MPQHPLVLVAAPSGAGKTSIARRLMQQRPQIQFSVSATTRPPREGETHGEDYHFLSEAEFRRRIDAGDLLEYEEVYPGRFYGTLRSEVEDKRRDGPVLLDVDVKGAVNIKSMYEDDALFLFIAPPSRAELRRRLSKRGTENAAAVQQRLDRAALEMTYAEKADVVIVNDDLDVAVEETLASIDRFTQS
jgi:guanylate kinase